MFFSVPYKSEERGGWWWEDESGCYIAVNMNSTNSPPHSFLQTHVGSEETLLGAFIHYLVFHTEKKLK